MLYRGCGQSVGFWHVVADGASLCVPVGLHNGQHLPLQNGSLFNRALPEHGCSRLLSNFALRFLQEPAPPPPPEPPVVAQRGEGRGSKASRGRGRDREKGQGAPRAVRDGEPSVPGVKLGSPRVPDCFPSFNCWAVGLSVFEKVCLATCISPSGWHGSAGFQSSRHVATMSRS
jgi:hypothetical protein